MTHTKIGILDFIPRDKEADALEAYQATVKLVQHADKAGIYRYWYAEHHATPSILGSSPQIMCAYATAVTDRIHVGTGGVMLDNFSAFQVAENFKVLEALAPGRIEAGVGYSNAKEQRAQEDMGPFFKKEENPYPRQLDELSYLLSDKFPDNYDHTPVRATPILYDQVTPMYILVASRRNAKMIAEKGWGLCFGAFLNPDMEECKETIRIYKENYKPNGIQNEPEAIISLYVVSSYKAEIIPDLENAIDYWILAFAQDKRSVYQLLSPTDAKDYPFSDEEKKELAPYSQAKVVGRPDQVERQLRHIQRTTQCDSFVVINQVPGVANRMDLIDIVSEIDL